MLHRVSKFALLQASKIASPHLCSIWEFLTSSSPNCPSLEYCLAPPSSRWSLEALSKPRKSPRLWLAELSKSQSFPQSRFCTKRSSWNVREKQKPISARSKKFLSNFLKLPEEVYLLLKLPKVFQRTPKSSTKFRKDLYNKDSSEEVNFRRQSLSAWFEHEFILDFDHLPFSLWIFCKGVKVKLTIVDLTV